MGISNREVRAVQVCYPQIYLACHTRHTRRRSSVVNLSPADATLLAHLDERRPVSATELAEHLGVAPSTLSAAIGRLGGLGYLARERKAGDGRVAELRLSKRGALAMQAGSVLDAARVKTLLAALGRHDRQRALDGLALLAGAARTITGKGRAR